MGKIKTLMLLVSSSLVLAGCTTARIAEYQPPSVSITERTARESGVEVALDPFVERARTEKYFDVDAVGQGIAILHVRVTNKTAGQTILVKKENFRLLRNGAGGLTGGAKIERSTTGANTIAWAGLVVYGALTPAAMLSSMAMVSRATEVQRNFAAKEMGDQTLSPGESLEGFIYFTGVKKGEDWSRITTVQAELQATKSQQVIELKIPLSQ